MDKMSKTINFSNLKRQEVRCIIYKGEEGKTVKKYPKNKEELNKAIEILKEKL
jgi:predicted dinucleotide-utilizing enzyme